MDFRNLEDEALMGRHSINFRRRLVTRALALAPLCKWISPLNIAQAEVGTIIAVVQGARGVMGWLGESRGVDADRTIIELQSAQHAYLSSISVGVENALKAIHDLKIFELELSRRAVHEAYDRQVMGSYLLFLEEERKFRGRLAEGGDNEGATRRFQREVRRLLQTVRRARTEVNLTGLGPVSSPVLTVCMAFMCEAEMAVALEEDMVEFQEISGVYSAYCNAMLSNDPGSLTTAIARETTKIDEFEKIISSLPYGSFDWSTPKSHDVDCVRGLDPLRGVRGVTLHQLTTATGTIADTAHVEDGLVIWGPNEQGASPQVSVTMNQGVFINGVKERPWTGQPSYYPSHPCHPGILVSNNEYQARLQNLAAGATAWTTSMHALNEARWRVLAMRHCSQVVKLTLAKAKELGEIAGNSLL